MNDFYVGQTVLWVDDFPLNRIEKNRAYVVSEIMVGACGIHNDCGSRIFIRVKGLDISFCSSRFIPFSMCRL